MEQDRGGQVEELGQEGQVGHVGQVGQEGHKRQEEQEGRARFERFKEIGRDLFVSGAITSHGGNISETRGRSIWITRTGAMLGRLTEQDILCASWDEGQADSKCSSELIVHRAIFHALAGTEDGIQGSKAIVHAHTAHTTTRSFLTERIMPMDSEGQLLMGEGVPVFAPKETIGSEEVASLLAHAMRPLSSGGEGVKIAVIQKHGPFAVGDTVEEAFQLISALEASCKILNLHDMLV